VDRGESLRKLREIKVTTPIIALSANALEGDREKYFKLRFND
jgi:CheY-like chemotaxis protein